MLGANSEVSFETPELAVPACYGLLDLPDELLGLCLSLGLKEPMHIASAALAHPRLRIVAKTAPLRLNIAAGPSDRPAAEQQRCLQVALAGLAASFPSTGELDLRGTVVGDANVAAVLASAPRLAALHLPSCRQLTPAVVAQLAAAASSKLRFLDLQRCYQMGADALSQLLAAARSPSAPMRVLSLSHLPLRDWPEAAADMVPGAAAAADHAQASPLSWDAAASGLRALALHNCSCLTSAGLLAIAEACPTLEALFLGGTTILPAEEAAPASIAMLGEAAEFTETAAVAGAEGALQALSQAPVDVTIGSLLHIAAAVEWTAAERGAVTAALDRLVACGRLPAAFARGYAAEVALELAVAALLLPRLSLLEITFAPPGVAHLLHLLLREPALAAARSSAGTRSGNGRSGTPPLALLDLCSHDCAEATSAWRLSCGAAAAGLTPEHADSLVEAAANCSAGGRCTPAHAAAEEGDARRLAALLALGAQADGRDKAGCTPLFRACEAGAVACARLLLDAGCSPTARNTAGEAPLYIASLRGHGRVVDLLLDACQHRGVHWTEPRLYGDGWSPLHAAAVGGHAAIGERLLAAAGPQGARALVSSANRYGQTPLHVAARKEKSFALLQAMLAAGDAACAAAKDCDNRSAAEVARRHGNAQAWRLLSSKGLQAWIQRTAAQVQARGTVPTAERTASGAGAVPRAGGWVGRRLQQRKAAEMGHQ